jgi:hypothetical protein
MTQANKQRTSVHKTYFGNAFKRPKTRVPRHSNNKSKYCGSKTKSFKGKGGWTSS